MTNTKPVKRSSNFTRDENVLLLLLAAKYKSTIENRTASVKEKRAVWGQLAEEFNKESLLHQRTVATLRAKYKGLKTQMRNANVDYDVSLFGDEAQTKRYLDGLCGEASVPFQDTVQRIASAVTGASPLTVPSATPVLSWGALEIEEEIKEEIQSPPPVDACCDDNVTSVDTEYAASLRAEEATPAPPDPSAESSNTRRDTPERSALDQRLGALTEARQEESRRKLAILEEERKEASQLIQMKMRVLEQSLKLRQEEAEREKEEHRLRCQLLLAQIEAVKRS